MIAWAKIKDNGDIQTQQNNWKWKDRSRNGHSSTQGRKRASFSIPKKKEGTCKLDEWSPVCWREDWRSFPSSNSDEANNAIKELLEKNGLCKKK